MPSGEMPGFGSMGGMTGVAQSASGTETLVLLGASALFLAVGLLVAFLFKRRK